MCLKRQPAGNSSGIFHSVGLRGIRRAWSKRLGQFAKPLLSIGPGTGRNQPIDSSSMPRFHFVIYEQVVTPPEADVFRPLWGLSEGTYLTVPPSGVPTTLLKKELGLRTCAGLVEHRRQERIFAD